MAIDHNIERGFQMTKWTKHITDDGKDQTLRPKPEGFDHKFRLLDDDKVIYGYGYCKSNQSFAPLNNYRNAYGCTEIQYYDKEKGWETL